MALRVPDLKSRDPKFNSGSYHQLDLFQIAQAQLLGCACTWPTVCLPAVGIRNVLGFFHEPFKNET